MNTEEQLKLLIVAYNELRADTDQFFEKEPNVDFWADQVIRCKTVEDKLKMLDFIDQVTDINSVIWSVLDILEGHNLSIPNECKKDDDQPETDQLEAEVSCDPYVEYLKKNHEEFYNDWKIRRIDDLLDKLKLDN